MLAYILLILATDNIATDPVERPFGPMPAVFELYVRERWEV